MAMRILPVIFAFIALAACDVQTNGFTGYVEGEYVYVSPTSGGNLAVLSIARGENIKKDQPLFSLETTVLKADMAMAASALDQAKAQLADLEKGMRPEEIDVIESQIDQAKSEMWNTQRQYERIAILVKKNDATKAQLDGRKSDYDKAAARVAELEAQLKTAKLSARVDAISASKAAVEIASQKYVQSQQRLRDAAPVSAMDAKVEDTFYRPDEFVPEGSPVVSLLPAENIKIRFFVPQAQLASVQVGQKITVHCDGCAQSAEATVAFIASQAEYTPPVIYSTESRQKLVFMVEARPDEPIAAAAALHPGMPVDVVLGPSR
jgi:HlyD family secretion protein